MPPSLRTLIVLLGSGKCVQNFDDQSFWKTLIWKTCKGWKNNIMKDFRAMGYEDSRSMETSTSSPVEDFHIRSVKYFSTFIIIIIIIIIIGVSIKCVYCELEN
jgi:hypothetical protein